MEVKNIKLKERIENSATIRAILDIYPFGSEAKREEIMDLYENISKSTYKCNGRNSRKVKRERGRKLWELMVLEGLWTIKNYNTNKLFVSILTNPVDMIYCN